MPRRKPMRSRQFRKPARPRRKRGPKITRMLKDKNVAHLRYVDTITIDAGTAAIASHVFRTNGIFDPDFTSTGHQPLMRDEWAVAYDQYRVLSSKIKVTPVLSGTSNLIPSLYGVYRDPDTTLTYTKGTSIIEDQRNKGTWGVTNLNATSVGKMDSKTATFIAKRDLGKDAAEFSNAQAADPVAPVATSFFQVWSASIGGNNPGVFTAIVQIDYIVEYTDPKHVTES